MAARKKGAKTAKDSKTAHKRRTAAPVTPAGQETGAVTVERERSPLRYTLSR